MPAFNFYRKCGLKLVPRWAAIAVTITAADRAVITRLKRELCDFLSTVGALPVAFKHLAIAARAVTAFRAAGAVAVATLHFLIFTRLKRKLRNLFATVSAFPVTLHHRARGKLASITTKHVLCA